MSKTRIQSLQRPMAKGKHQRKGQRAQVRENPPIGKAWGQKDWPGASSGSSGLYGVWLWDTGTTTAGMAATMIRGNNANLALVTHLYISEVQAAGGTGDPIATWVVNDPIRLYAQFDTSLWLEYKITAATDAGAYRDYTVTYTAAYGSWAPIQGTALLGMERTGSAVFDPGDETVDGVKSHVDGLTQGGEELRAEIQRILDAERLGKNRATLVEWLDAKLGVV